MDKHNQVTKTKTKKAGIADSWEDELSSSASETDEQPEMSATALSPSSANAEGLLAPLPTPISAVRQQPWTPGEVPSHFGSVGSPETSGRDSPGTPQIRPEKQTAVAGRLIAGALGIRPPKRTEEQRAYDRAMKEKEIKRRNRAQEEKHTTKEEEERVKAAIWDG
jgi:hypothetical protein